MAFAKDLENLPPGYTYNRQSHNDEVILGIKELKEISSRKLQWLQTWSDNTKVAWRKRTTYPKTGRFNCYKVDIKCQHAADKRVKGIHTKKTGCTAVLQIKVAEGSIVRADVYNENRRAHQESTPTNHRDMFLS